VQFLLCENILEFTPLYASTMMWYITTDSKAIETIDYGLKPLNCKPNRTFFFLGWLSQVFWYSNGRKKEHVCLFHFLACGRLGQSIHTLSSHNTQSQLQNLSHHCPLGAMSIRSTWPGSTLGISCAFRNPGVTMVTHACTILSPWTSPNTCHQPPRQVSGAPIHVSMQMLISPSS
jgi:hypothetical protein